MELELGLTFEMESEIELELSKIVKLNVFAVFIRIISGRETGL
jgi:hypothetical protein